MKIGLYADPHLSQTSSIIVGKSGDFSGRLTNLINSFKWMNDFFSSMGCVMTVCLGDVTDKPNLTAEEITALSLCGIEDHHLIVGNHCRADKDGRINSLSVFKKVYYEPRILEVPGPDCSRRILILPYNSTPVDLSQFEDSVDIILSHNDIKGYDFGGHVSEAGLELESILSHCSLFVNGHLHNGGWLVQDRVVNLGQLSGMNFSSCGGQWEPSVGILDTDTLSLEIYENPCAYRFKKEEFSSLTKLKGYLDNLPENGEYVLQARVPDTIAQKSRKLIDQCSKVVASRVLTLQTKSKKTSVKRDEIKLDKTSVYDKLRGFVTSQNPSKYSIEKINEIIDHMEMKEGAE